MSCQASQAVAARSHLLPPPPPPPFTFGHPTAASPAFSRPAGHVLCAVAARGQGVCGGGPHARSRHHQVLAQAWQVGMVAALKCAMWQLLHPLCACRLTPPAGPSPCSYVIGKPKYSEIAIDEDKSISRKHGGLEVPAAGQLEGDAPYVLLTGAQPACYSAPAACAVG